MSRVSLSTWLRYYYQKAHYSVNLGMKNSKLGLVKEEELAEFACDQMLFGRLTFLHRSKGEEMAPTIAGEGATLLVRKILIPGPSNVSVGDVVVLKNPDNLDDDYLVRRLAATGGDEMASTDEKEEPFVLEKNQCWVVAENEKLKAKGIIFVQCSQPKWHDAIDSRTFGPIHMTNIVGRVLYCLRSAVDHGIVRNSRFSRLKDSPVLEMELDIDEMVRNQ